jgi:hypothetical protein
VSDPLARFARVSPSVRGRAAEGGRGSLTHHARKPWLRRRYRLRYRNEDSYARGIHFPPSTVPLGKNLWFPFRLFP